MMHIIANNPNDAWLKTFIELYDNGSDRNNDKYWHDEPVVIELTEAKIDTADERFPMEQAELDIINNFIWSGQDEPNVVHKWTKLYHHRAFDEPNSQIEYMINELQKPQPSGDAVVSMWDKDVDQNAEVSPCTMVLWGRVRGDTLDLHVHAHSSDAYKKLLMNILEFVSLHDYLAKRLDLAIGTYLHIIDSCHLHKKHKVLYDRLRQDLTIP